MPIPSDPPQHKRQCQGFPGKEKQGRNSADVERNHKSSRPVDWLGKRFVSLENAHGFPDPHNCISSV
jgi:hypothetical protein